MSRITQGAILQQKYRPLPITNLLYRGVAKVKVSGYYAARQKNDFQLEPQILKSIQSFHSNVTFCHCQKQLQHLNFNTGVPKLWRKDILG